MGWIKEAEHFRDMGHTWNPELWDEPIEESPMACLLCGELFAEDELTQTDQGLFCERCAESLKNSNEEF